METNLIYTLLLDRGPGLTISLARYKVDPEGNLHISLLRADKKQVLSLIQDHYKRDFNKVFIHEQ